MTTIKKFIEQLNSSDIRYCHWKSNYLLTESLSGRTDIDLLVDRTDAKQFRNILNQLNFKPAVTTNGDPFPSVEHYYAHDEQSGIIVHVHAYYRVITGESLTKNYRFPIEEMLLQNTRELKSVRVPTQSAELIIFTLRMMLKHTSLVELILLKRYWKEVKKEIEWLLETGTINDSKILVRDWLPSLDPELFTECLKALIKPASLFRRVMLGIQLRDQISLYARNSTIKVWLNGIRKFSVMFFRRFFHSQKSIALRSGGAMIAFVGSEATGKSTLLAETRAWLGEHFSVEQIHVGKPKSTWVSAGPNLFLPILRSLFPSSRTTQISDLYDHQEQLDRPKNGYPLIFAVRSALLSYDRWSLLSRAYSQAANGTIVLCDRYPSIQSGAIDSPQLSQFPDSTSRYSVRRRLSNIEAQRYKEIPNPDLVIYLTAPIEVTLLRNENRNKKEPEDHVRKRHAKSSHLDFGNIPVHEINTNQPFEKTILEVKKVIWDVL
jgi:thymidylate kinase